MFGFLLLSQPHTYPRYITTQFRTACARIASRYRPPHPNQHNNHNMARNHTYMALLHTQTLSMYQAHGTRPFLPSPSSQSPHCPHTHITRTHPFAHIPTHVHTKMQVRMHARTHHRSRSEKRVTFPARSNDGPSFVFSTPNDRIG